MRAALSAGRDELEYPESNDILKRGGKRSPWEFVTTSQQDFLEPQGSKAPSRATRPCAKSWEQFRELYPVLVQQGEEQR